MDHIFSFKEPAVSEFKPPTLLTWIAVATSELYIAVISLRYKER